MTNDVDTKVSQTVTKVYRRNIVLVTLLAVISVISVSFTNSDVAQNTNGTRGTCDVPVSIVSTRIAEKVEFTISSPDGTFQSSIVAQKPVDPSSAVVIRNPLQELNLRAKENPS
ncbi:MAG: hypothetical protein EXR59_04060 [Dehalococcoidia bacterium]|nr:hypothetical protein [Dehalococcoidia bacterium]